MRCISAKAMPSTTELLNFLKFEVLNNIDYYGGFLNFNFSETDFVVERDSYISKNQYSSGTIDVVLSALANALRCIIILLKKRENGYYVEFNDHVINSTQSRQSLPSSSFGPGNITMFWLRNPLLQVFIGFTRNFYITYFLTKHGLYQIHDKR